MKILVTSYAFDKTAKTITFSGYGSINLNQILLITNTTSNTIIYNFADSTRGGTVATNVLTLTYDTSVMANTDKLQIYYDDTNAAQKVDGSAVTQPVSIATMPSTPVTGTFWQATQPVSAASLPLPTGAALEAGHLATIDTSTATTATNTTGAAKDVTLTGGSQVTKLTDGTNTANILKSDGTAAGQNAQLVAGAYKEVTFTTTTVQAVASTDVSNYKWVSVHVTSQGTSSTITFQGSNDNTNWVSVGLLASPVANGIGHTSTTTTTGIWHGPIGYRYFRLNVTGISALTTAGVIEFYTSPASSQATSAISTQSGAWNVGSSSATGSAVPANAFYIGTTNSGGNLTGLENASIGDGRASILSAAQYRFNGTSQDRVRANEDVSLLASASRTTTQTSADLVNYNGLSALVVVLDMTVVGTGSVTISINRKDTASGKYINILTGAAVTTNSTNVYRVGPNVAAVANSIAQDYLGRTFQIVVTANNANAASYSVGYSLVRG